MTLHRNLLHKMVQDIFTSQQRKGLLLGMGLLSLTKPFEQMIKLS